MEKLITIAKAYFKLLLVKTIGLPEEDLLEAERRRLICGDCTLNTDNWCDSKKCVAVHYKNVTVFGELLHGYKKICGCGCYIPAKKFTENKEDCPLKKW